MKRHLPVALLLLLAAAGCVNASDPSAAANSEVTADDSDSHSVNGSIHVLAGRKSVDAGTVNGNIRVDDGGAVSSAHTVNGDIRIGAHATVDSLHTVNGAITLGSGAEVKATASTVNGALEFGNGAHVGGAVSTVNGKIVLASAAVSGGIATVNGDINLKGSSHVAGGIVVRHEHSSSWFNFERRVPRIVIGPGASVQGEMRFERKVDLYVSDRATIGAVVGATPIPFSGETPPP